MDIHALYELCVQSPSHVVTMLRAIHGHRPSVLAEDFAGTAAVSRAWCASDPGARAIATDLDESALSRAATEPRIERVVADVRAVGAAPRHRADALFVGNFSIGYLHTRPDLLAYLRVASARLHPGGVLVCDTYGGESAFRVGVVERVHTLPPGVTSAEGPGCRVRYTWEQREADPLTGMVLNVLHFRLERGRGKDREVIAEFPEAFTYRWRLWSVPELRDAMGEVGLTRTDVYATLPDAVDDQGRAYVQPIRGQDLDDSYIVLVAGRAV